MCVWKEVDRFTSWRLRRLVVCLALLGVAMSPARALAQGGQGAGVDEARSHFMRGVELYQDAEYEAALAEFNRANEIAPHYGLLYNIGLVQAHLQDYPQAVTALERYLSEGGGEVPDRRRTEVNQLLRRFRRYVGRIRVDVRGPESALVYVDGAEVGRSPLEEPVAVTVGRRTVEVRADGFLPFRRSVIVAGGVEAEVRALMLRTEAQMGAIVLTTAVVGVTITLDGEEVGVTPLEGPVVANPGRHVIEASRPGYDTEGRSVEVTLGEVTPLEITLRPLDPIPDELAGELEVEASEDDAEVLLDGALFEGGPVPIGQHTVEVRLEGFQPWWGEVEVSREGVTTVEALLRPTEGFLQRYRRRARIFYIAGALTLTVGVAALLADVGVYVWNSGRHDEWAAEDAFLNSEEGQLLDENERRARYTANEELNQSLKQWNVIMIALVAAGIAVTGAGVAILATAPRVRRYLRLSFAPSPGGFAFGLSLSFM